MIEKVIAYVESRNFQFAIRFESTLYNSKKYDLKTLDKIKLHNECSIDTAKMIYFSAWGKYQIMGFNLYSSICNINCPIGGYLCTDVAQDISFFKFCHAKKLNLDETEKELITLHKVKIKFKNTYSKLSDFTQAFKNYLIEHKDTYAHLFEFITKYNGARFISDAFYSYLLRMLYAYERLQKAEGV